MAVDCTNQPPFLSQKEFIKYNNGKILPAICLVTQLFNYTISMITISAALPRLAPSLMILVYPPP